MKKRCYAINTPGYELWGGRGIKVCDSWRYNFERFLDDMGKCPDGYSLDRIDVNGHYEPSNCRWASASVQANNARSNVFVEYDGKSQTLAQWSVELGINYPALYRRIVLMGERPPLAFRKRYVRAEA
jgi:hypothetical protein